LKSVNLYEVGQQKEMNKISSLVMFKTGVKPEWEDPANSNGGNFLIKMKQDDPNLKELWNQLVCGLVSGTLPNVENICGIRFLEKHANAKFEIWTNYHKKDGAAHKELENKLGDLLGGVLGINAPAIEFNKHGES